MAASAADVRSILSIPAQTVAPQATQKKPQATSARKPEGISRELYSLIGPSAPSLAAQLTKPRLKQKPNLGNRSCVKWEWRTFKNSARADNLELGHWTKASTEPNALYPFTRYNVRPTVYSYTDEEYTQYLQDQAWTKEETDYLFRTVQEYDIRWYVINDRYEYPNGVTRSLEDLKDRYYSVCRKLVRNRPWTGDEAAKTQLIQSFQFDKEREVTRKKYVTSLENRTPEQIAEEEALFIELKRLEQNERRFKRDREELLRLLAGVESGLPDIVEDEASFSAPLPSDFIKKKKTKGGTSTGVEADAPGPSNVIALGPPIIRKPQNPKSAAYDAQHCITRTDQVSGTTTKAAHHPAFLRSFKIPFPKAALAPRINQSLAELGVNTARLVMPTRENCARLESLIEAATAMVETKKTMDKVEYEIRVAKGRLGMRESEEAGSGGGPADSVSAGVPADSMDVDTVEAAGDDVEEEVAEDGREQSVVSVRSARGRRQSRRSMSISSVDTSATVSTRAGTKRQKRV